MCYVLIYCENTLELMYSIFNQIRSHDNVTGKGVRLGATTIHTLGYVDDVSLLDESDTEGITIVTAHITKIAVKSREDTDIHISIPKTKVLNVRAQDEVSKTTSEEVSAVYKYIYPYYSCDFQFRHTEECSFMLENTKRNRRLKWT